ITDALQRYDAVMEHARELAVLDPLSLFLDSSLEEQAAMHKAQGNNARSGQLTREAEDLKKARRGRDEIGMAEGLDSLAWLHAWKGELAKAETMYLCSLRFK